MDYITSSRESTRYTNSFDVYVLYEEEAVFSLSEKFTQINRESCAYPALISVRYLLAFIKAASFQAVQFAQTPPVLRLFVLRSMYFSVVLRHKNISNSCLTQWTNMTEYVAREVFKLFSRVSYLPRVALSRLMNLLWARWSNSAE
jgi:hypothetical protein